MNLAYEYLKELAEIEDMELTEEGKRRVEDIDAYFEQLEQEVEKYNKIWSK